MDPYKPGQIKNQGNIEEDSEKSSMVFSWRLKGLVGGAGAMLFYANYYVGKNEPYMIVAAGILGYFLGGVLAAFFYTKK